MRSAALLLVLGCSSYTDPANTVAQHPQPRVAIADGDRDRDGIPDRCDCCPDLPEVYQGIDDEDGCPDTCVLRVGDPLEDYLAPSEWIEGEPSPAALDATALGLRARNDVEAVMCIGQAAATEANPIARSRRRAKLVCDGLAARGIPVGLLESVGVGSGEMRHVAGQYVEAPRSMTIVQVVRAAGKKIWIWDGNTLQVGERNRPHSPAQACCPAPT